MAWFKNKAVSETLVEKARPQGLFSTDLDAYAPMYEDFIGRSIQKTQVRAVDADGKSMAMDSDLTQGNGINDIKILGAGSYYGVNPVQFEWFASQGFIGWQNCAVIAQHWLVDKACAMPGKDAVRHGYDITFNEGEDIDPAIITYMRKRDRQFKIKQKLTEFVHMGRVFGIRVTMFEVKSRDPKYYEKPFNPDGITPGSYLGPVQIDPYWITPLLDAEAVSNPASGTFYEPTWWQVRGVKVHKSHLVIYRTSYLADLLKPTYLYGGVPLPQRIAERVYAAERTANEAPALALAKRSIVMYTDLEKAAANQTRFQRAMNFWTQTMNNFGVKILGIGDKLEQYDISLADFDATIMTQYQLAAAVAGVPCTKLIETTPKGFNSTGESEQRSYNEDLETIQENDLSPFLERHHLMLMRSEVMQKFGLSAPLEMEVKWKPVDSPSAAELSDINLKKAQTDTALAATGAIGPEDIRQRVATDPSSSYNGIELDVPEPIVETGLEPDNENED